MQRSKLDIGGADAGAGGMPITSGSSGASGLGASSSSSDASAMAQSTRSSGAGSGSVCLEESSSWAWSAAALCDGLAELGVAACEQAMPPSCPRLVLVAEVRGCASCPLGRRLAPPCFTHDQAFEVAIEDGAGKSGARLRLDAALEAAEDGHVAGLQARRAVRREEAQYDVWESGLHGGQGGLAGVDAGHVPEKDPRLSFFAWVHHVV